MVYFFCTLKTHTHMFKQNWALILKSKQVYFSAAHAHLIISSRRIHCAPQRALALFRSSFQRHRTCTQQTQSKCIFTEKKCICKETKLCIYLINFQYVFFLASLLLFIIDVVT